MIFLDSIGMYNVAHKIRQIIHIYNENYWMQTAYIDTNFLVMYMRQIYEIGTEDIAYWGTEEIGFQSIDDLIVELQNADKSMDYVMIYDLLNFELWQMIKRVVEVLFKKNGKELCDYFATENEKAMKKRFPEVLRQIDTFGEGSQCEDVRDYGLRGRVVYRKKGSFEFDLYSAYNMVGLKRMRNIDYAKDNLIYVWGCNGGFEINEIAIINTIDDIRLEINVTDLNEFSQILRNTYRGDALLNPRINWRFDLTEEELIKNFDLKNREKSYIYVCDGAENTNLLKEFICANELDSNIGDNNGEYIN